MKTKVRVYLGLGVLLVAVIIVSGLGLAPSGSKVSAASQEYAGGATVEMLNYALNFKSAQSLGVFGGNSVSDNGSDIRGTVGSTGEVLGVASNAMSLGDAAENRRDLLDVFSVVDQLPCTQVNGDLNGQTFTPGVYCVGDATLAGRMTVDAGGDVNARFVFRVDGTFTARDSASIERTGEAQATNVYVFSRGSANVGSNASIGSNLISRDSVRVGHGSTVSGKVIGVEGTVTTDSNIVAAGTGYVEICKNIVSNGIVPDPIPAGTIFDFTVSGVNGTIQVPAGGCSPPIQVAAGNVTITEAARPNTALLGFNVSPFDRTVTNFSPTLQQLVVAVPAGDVNDQTVVGFFNQTTRTGTVEICKFGRDQDVSGFFNYTVQGAPGQIFAVPVGFCSGPITVTIGLRPLGNQPPIAHPGTNFEVNSIADTDDGVCDAANCTLREAINAANANPGADTITFGISGTILLGPTAAPLITDNLSIDGVNRSVTIDGGGTILPLNVGAIQAFNLNAVTVANGSSGTGGGLLAGSSDTTITRCRFLNNRSAQGGAIFAAGQTMKIDSTTFAGNSSTVLGGAIFNTGILTITNSLFTGNSSALGGAIASGATLNVTNSTFFNNTAGSIGGGVYTFGNATFTNTTFSTNSAVAGGGGAIFNGVNTTLQNTLLTNSPTGGNCANAPVLANSFNISDDISCGGATVRTAAQINLAAAPANNGGPTQTMALTLPSAAADTGDNSVCPLTDQRGAFRPANSTAAPTARCDVGAYEISTTMPFTANVTELAKDTYRLENVTTFPVSALNSWTPDQGYDANGLPIVNTNGGFANVSLNVAGGAANQTTVRFFNRSLPGRIKVCKITADPVNLPVGTAIRFAVGGLQGPYPGTVASVVFDVLAGPASQGGFCAFAPGVWVVGENVQIGEGSISPDNTTDLPLGLTATVAGLRRSSITASTPFSPTPATVPGFNTYTSNPILSSGLAVIAARNTTAEVTFTNFVYRPAILKLCKNAGPGIAAGTPFTFTLAPADPLTTLPFGALTTPVSVAAGSCTFVNGPFPPTSGFPGVGTFNFGTSIIVTESAAAGTALLDISSPTLTATGGLPNFNGTLTKDIANRKATFTLNHVSGIPVPPLTPANYYFNELAFTNTVSLGPPLITETRFDFDGDHRSDIVVFRPTDGTWYYSPSSDGGVRGVQFGANGDIPMAADYDGDGVADPAVFRPSTGTWYMLGSTNGFSAMQFGMSSDIPAAADFDGDGRADVAVFRPSNGTWYIMGSTAGFSGVQFGMNGDVPVAADFDGDHRADVSVFRPSSGTWYMLRSTAGFTGVQFGMNGDIPVGADYDGDGRADAAVFRPSTGTWYMLGSTAGFSGVQFGMAGDTPVPADYDGDGRTDVGVYRPSDRTWYILNSSQSRNAVGGFSAIQFGANGDLLTKY